MTDPADRAEGRANRSAGAPQRFHDVCRRLGDAVPQLVADGSAVDHEVACAALVWSAVSEPGDLDAGLVTAGLGQVRAAEILFADDAAHGVVRALIDEAGIDAVAAQRVLAQLPKAAARWTARCDVDRVESLARAAVARRARLVVPGSPSWPAVLDELGGGAPQALWVAGEVAALTAAGMRGGSAGIVGSRSATPYGVGVAVDIADGLGRAGCAIVSGGAFGIDIAAHRAALAGRHATVAFLAGGLDRLYPQPNAPVLQRIVHEGGALVSELPFGQAPTKWRFLKRNRLIAALSTATIVIEAGWRSGAINTAGHAAELGRPLGAVPGPITSAASAGCHRLVREYNAQLVTSSDEALELVRGLDAAASRPQPGLDGPELGEEASRVLDALSGTVGRGGQTVHDVAVRVGLGEAIVRGALAELELEGRALSDGTRWRRARATRR